MPPTRPYSVCVYCASSRQAHEEYRDVAYRLGEVLAGAGCSIVYGGGGGGSMGALADGALQSGGRVVGVMPRFMTELAWAHDKLTELRVVEDMRVRKHLMISDSRAVIALPGGSGTLEELLETITLKRLGIYLEPIILVNTRGFFDSLISLLEHSVAERFMDERHLQMWQVVASPEEVIDAIEQAPSWTHDARTFANL